MEFKELGRYTIIGVTVVGVIGLIYQLFIEGSLRLGAGIPFDHEFGRLNSARFFLLAWETFWLTSIALFFIWVAKRAKTEKTAEEIERLEEFEPKLFKIVIGLLILAAILTLILPIFMGQNTLVHYNVNDEGVEVEVVASQFLWTIDGLNCDLTDQPSGSCITLQTGVRYIFLLESADTTHGFTIYDDNNVLLTQAQIVPDYVTRVAFTFTTTGDYSIRCAEYCGSVHHLMYAAFTVEAGS